MYNSLSAVILRHEYNISGWMAGQTGATRTAQKVKPGAGDRLSGSTPHLLFRLLLRCRRLVWGSRTPWAGRSSGRRSCRAAETREAENSTDESTPAGNSNLNLAETSGTCARFLYRRQTHFCGLRSCTVPVRAKVPHACPPRSPQ